MPDGTAKLKKLVREEKVVRAPTRTVSVNFLAQPKQIDISCNDTQNMC